MPFVKLLLVLLFILKIFYFSIFKAFLIHLGTSEDNILFGHFDKTNELFPVILVGMKRKLQ